MLSAQIVQYIVRYIRIYIDLPLSLKFPPQNAGEQNSAIYAIDLPKIMQKPNFIVISKLCATHAGIYYFLTIVPTIHN